MPPAFAAATTQYALGGGRLRTPLQPAPAPIQSDTGMCRPKLSEKLSPNPSRDSLFAFICVFRGLNFGCGGAASGSLRLIMTQRKAEMISFAARSPVSTAPSR